MNLSGKRIVLGVTGSIAAYKTILLTRLLVKQGAEVRVVMTLAAADFVSPLVVPSMRKLHGQVIACFGDNCCVRMASSVA